MRRLLIVVCLAGMAIAARAQSSEIPTQKYNVGTGSFWSNWFVQAGVAGTSFYGDKGNAPGKSISSGLLKDFRTDVDFTLSLGKWFTPVLGVRTKWSGVWARSVTSEDKDDNSTKFWTLNEQILCNLSNLFAGYSETRRWNLISYLSGGVGRNMTCDTYAMGLGLGLLNQWSLTDKISLDFDLSWNAYEPDFDGAGGNIFARGVHGKDQFVSAEIGITYRLGKATFDRIPDVETINTLLQSQIDALNAQLADEQAENARLMEKISQMEKRQP